MRWSRASIGPDGNLAVSFPHIRWAFTCPITAYHLIPQDVLSWAFLRATEGWAALQHHTVLRTTLTVLPPRSDSDSRLSPAAPKLLVELKRGSFFTVVPADVEWKQRRDFVPEWYSGNIYDVHSAPPHLVKLPTIPSAGSPTVYNLYVSGDYEVLELLSQSIMNTLLRCTIQIRLFGDPEEAGSEAPTLSISVRAYFEPPSINFRRETSSDIAPDFVEGFAFGDALGVGLRCLSKSWWNIAALSPSPQLREAVRVQCIYRATGPFAYPYSNIGNCAFPTHECSLCPWADACPSNPNLAVQSIRRECPLVRRACHY